MRIKIKRICRFVVLLTVAVVTCMSILCNCTSSTENITPERAEIKVGYLQITPNLPFYVAMETGLFGRRGLKVTAVPLKTSNEIVEGLVAKRIDFTTVAALSVLQSLEVASPGRIKIYQINYIPCSDPNDYLIVKKDSPIQRIEDLKGKKLALFPGSNFEVWTDVILGQYFGFGKDYTATTMPPQNLVQALAAGSVDAIYCLEPTATIALQKGVGRTLEVGLVCKYIFDPFPVTGNAVLAEFAAKNPNTTRVFYDVMTEAMEMVDKEPDKYRSHLVKYCSIPKEVAAKVKLGHGKPSSKVDIQTLQKTVDLYLKARVLTKPVDMSRMLLYPPK